MSAWRALLLEGCPQLLRITVVVLLCSTSYFVVLAVILPSLPLAVIYYSSSRYGLMTVWNFVVFVGLSCLAPLQGGLGISIVLIQYYTVQWWCRMGTVQSTSQIEVPHD